MGYSINSINTLAGTSYPYDILALNALCIAQGGTGGHTYSIDALNELCTLLGITAGHTYIIDALNTIVTAIGGTGTYTYEDTAWQFIADTGLGLSSLASKMAIWLGDLDFVNNKWLDKTGNTTGATLGGGNCILIAADTTVTLKTARVGATVSNVNGSATTTGVTVNGSGHIAIANATIPSPKKIASIELSTGELFRFTAGSGRIAFASGNYGIISGTAGTEWSWSTIDTIHLNWQYGFSDAYEMTDGTSYIQVNNLTVDSNSWWRVKWGGVIINVASTNSFWKLNDVTEAFPITCQVTKSGGNTYIDFGSYTSGGYKDARATYAGDLFGTYHEYEFEFSGADKTALSSFSFKIDGVAYTLTAAGNNTGSGVYTTLGYSAATGANTICFWNYFKVESSVLNTLIVANGKSTSIVQVARSIPFIPSFNGTTDAFGRAITGAPATKEHNGCESWFKMPADATVIANDVNGYLFTTGTPNALYSTAVFDVISSKKIVCNNSNRYAIQDFIVFKESVSDSVLTLINAYNSAPVGKLIFRIDRTHDGAVKLGKTINTQTNYFSALNAAGIKGSMIYPLDSFGPVNAGHTAAFAAGHSFEMHGVIQSFFIFPTYKDGKASYDLSTPTEKTDSIIVNPDQGKISGSITVAEIERLHTVSGLAYPNGIAPSGDDDNYKWWEYVLDAFKMWASNTGITLTMFSPLGSAGGTFRPFRKELMDMVMVRFRTYSGVTLNGSGTGEVYTYTDSIDSSVNPFKGKGLTIYNDGALNWIKMSGYGGSSNAILDLSHIIQGFDPIRYGNWILQFDIKNTQAGSYMPLKNVVMSGVTTTFTSGGNINLFSSSYNVSNTMVVNTTYKIKIEKSGTYFLLTVYNSDGTVLIGTRHITVADASRFIYLETDGDTLIRNVRFDAFDHKGIYYLAMYSFDGVYESHVLQYGTTTWQNFIDNRVKKDIVTNMLGGLNHQLFFHELGSFADIPDSGLDNVRYCHSLDAMNRVIAWGQVNGLPIGDPATIVRPTSTGRVNYFPNPKFEATKYGVTIIDAANVSTEVAPDKSSGVYKILSGTYKSWQMMLPSSGMYRFSFWVKGTCAINFSSYHTLLSYPGYSFTTASLVRKEIFVNVGEANCTLSIGITNTGDTHIACPVFERISDLTNV